MTRVAVDYGPAVLAWCAAAYKLPELWRRPSDPGLRAVCLIFIFMVAALTTALPPVYEIVDGVTGVPNVAKLLVYSFGVLASWNVHRYFVYMANDQPEAFRLIRRHRPVLVGTLLLMTVLFAIAPVDKTEPVYFTDRYGSHPAVMGLEAVLLGYMGWLMYRGMRQSWHYGSSAAALIGERPATWLGLRLVSIGMAGGIIFTVERVFHKVTQILGLPYPGDNPELVADLLKVLVVIFCLVGATMPAWGPAVGLPTLYRFLARYRAYRRLHRVWLDLCTVRPEISLFPPRRILADLLDFRDLRLRLYRQVIEIQDGLARLRVLTDPRVVDFVRERSEEKGLTETETRVTVDATVLAVAVGDRGTSRRNQHHHKLSMRPSRGGLDHEVAHIGRVAEYYDQSPIVREAVSHFRGMQR